MFIKSLLKAFFYKQLYFIVSISIFVSLFYILSPNEFYYYGTASIIFLFLRNMIDTVCIQLYLNYRYLFFKSKYLKFLFLVNVLVLFTFDFNTAENILILLSLLISYFLANYSFKYACYLNYSEKYRQYNTLIALSEIFSFFLFLVSKDYIFYAVLIKNISYFGFQIALFKIYCGELNLKKQVLEDITVKEHSMFFIFNYFSKNLDKILVSAIFGNYAFVLYDRAFTAIRMLLSLITFSVAPALLLNLKKVEKNKLNNVYLKYQQSFFLIGILGVFTYFQLIEFASNLLNSEWKEIRLYLDNVIYLIPLMLMIGNTSQFFLNESRTKLNLISAIFSFLSIVFFLIGLGLIGTNLVEITKFMLLPIFLNLVQINYLYLIKIRSRSNIELFYSIFPQLVYVLICLTLTI